MVNWLKVTAILAIIGTILAGYFSYPKLIWVVQQGKIQQFCPSLLINDSQAFVILKNGGQVPATIAVTFNSTNISFKNDMGLISNHFLISYVTDPQQIQNFPFMPIFNQTGGTFNLQISTGCYVYLGEIGFGCFNRLFNRCCSYSYYSSNALSLINETTFCEE